MGRSDYKHVAKIKCYCGLPALYRVSKLGFCRQHYAEGVKAQAKLLDRRKAFAIRNK